MLLLSSSMMCHVDHAYLTCTRNKLSQCFKKSAAENCREWRKTYRIGFLSASYSFNKLIEGFTFGSLTLPFFVAIQIAKLRRILHALGPSLIDEKFQIPVAFARMPSRAHMQSIREIDLRNGSLLEHHTHLGSSGRLRR